MKQVRAKCLNTEATPFPTCSYASETINQDSNILGMVTRNTV